MQLIAERASEDCGCPEEEWIMRNINVLIHFEPDGSGHIILDAGDWDDEATVRCSSMDDLREQAKAWVDSLPEEGAAQ